MRTSPFLVLAAAGLLAVGCGKMGADGSESADANSAGQGVEGYFNPQNGETWKYKVQKEVPIEIALSVAEASRRPQRTESGHLITFERVRTCTGPRQLEGGAGTVTSMEILENGIRRGEELYDIGPKGIFSRGWLGHEQDKAGARVLLKDPVPIAMTKMQPGQVWTASGLDPDRRFLFRVIEHARVTVPAGKFDAARIQITSSLGGKSLKRTIWFAENVGIVKEESVYYGPQRTRVREHAELVHWVVPSTAPPGEENLVSKPDQEEPPPGDDGSGKGSSGDPPAGEQPAGGDEPTEENPGEELNDQDQDSTADPDRASPKKDNED